MINTQVCTRCKRTRNIKYLTQRRVRSGKLAWRCSARSVCSSIHQRAKRN